MRTQRALHRNGRDLGGKRGADLRALHSRAEHLARPRQKRGKLRAGAVAPDLQILPADRGLGLHLVDHLSIFHHQAPGDEGEETTRRPPRTEVRLPSGREL